MTRTDMWTRTRRPLLQCTVAIMTILLAVTACGLSSTAFAQETDSQRPVSECGPEGSWLYTVTIPGFTTFQGIETYSAGGGYSEADQLSFLPIAVASAGHGAWKMTGPRTFLLTYLNLTFDGFSSGVATGTLRVRQTTKLDKSGNSYTGSGDYAYFNPDGTPGSAGSGTFTITAKRITVEAPK